MRRLKRKMKNTLVGLTFVLAFVAYIAAVASVAEPGFDWDMLPVAVAVAAVSLLHIVLVGYANSDAYRRDNIRITGMANKRRRERHDYKRRINTGTE